MTHNVSVTTSMVTTATIDIDGREYPLSFAPDQMIDPVVTEGGDALTVRYAMRDECPFNPRDDYDHIGIMVRVRDGYGGIPIDEPDNEIAALWEVASDLDRLADCEPFYYADDETGEEFLVFGYDSDMFHNGETYGIDPSNDWGLDNLEAVGAMLAEAMGIRSTVESIARAYLSVARPDVRGFQEWSINGYCQSDWAEGYIYTTAPRTVLADEYVDSVLTGEVKEYEAWAYGDVYCIVEETWSNAQECEPSDEMEGPIGGFYGTEYAERVVREGL